MQTSTYSGDGERIDTRLSKEFGYSRNFFHHIISRGGILVNQKPIKKSHKLKPQDQISIDNLQRYLSPLLLEEAPNIEIPIIKETQDYLIINKPKGVLSHPNSIREVGQASVVGFLYHRYKDLPSYGNFIRAGLIHRLDKDTNGIMIIAKTETGLQHFKNLFQQKSESKTLEEKENIPLKKFYKANCHLTHEGETFLKGKELPFYIIENVISKTPNSVAKEGITKILNYEKSEKTILIELEILTGRTHQIRYHLSHHGLPLLGDYLYGKDEGPVQLTAYKMIYQDINGELQTIELS